MRRSNNKNRIKVYRTMEGNIFEAVTAVLLIIIWILTFKELGAGATLRHPRQRQTVKAREKY